MQWLTNVDVSSRGFGQAQQSIPADFAATTPADYAYELTSDGRWGALNRSDKPEKASSKTRHLDESTPSRVAEIKSGKFC